MATFAARAQALVDALLNRTATQSELIRCGRAYARRDNKLAEYDVMPLALQAEYFVTQVAAAQIAFVREQEIYIAVAASGVPPLQQAP